MVLPISIAILHLGSITPDDHHFLPLITYSSPSFSIVVEIFVASEEATSGSVIRYAERISPARSGFNHFSFCSSLPYLSITSMFPVSGAEQLNTSPANPTLPKISHNGAYSTFVNPAPLSDSGRNKFHRPSALAFSFKSSSI